MMQYLVAIHRPDDYDPSVETEAMSRDIDALNDEMVAAGVRIFVGGLSAASSARSQRVQPDGKVLITDGPYLETKEHIGGFGCWKPLTWMRHWRGGARLPSPVGRRSRCARLTDGGPNGSNRAAVTTLSRKPRTDGTFPNLPSGKTENVPSVFSSPRFHENKNSSPLLSIFCVRDDYRMNDPARKVVLLAPTKGEE
jgi:hypothetical protein